MSMSIAPSGKNIGKALKAGYGLLGAGVGIVTFVNASNAKAPNPGWSFTGQMATAVSRMVGPQIAGAIFSKVPGSMNLNASNLPAQSITPMGILNAYTIGGIVLLAVDHFLLPYIGGSSKYLRPLAKAIGGGLTAGGVFGGLFDAPGDGTSGPLTAGGPGFLAQTVTSPLRPAPAASQPFLSVTGVKLHGR